MRSMALLDPYVEAAEGILSPGNAGLNATLRWRERAARLCLWELESLRDRYRVAISLEADGATPVFTLVVGSKVRPGLTTVYSSALTGIDGHESVSLALAAAMDALATRGRS